MVTNLLLSGVLSIRKTMDGGSCSTFYKCFERNKNKCWSGHSPGMIWARSEIQQNTKGALQTIQTCVAVRLSRKPSRNFQRSMSHLCVMLCDYRENQAQTVQATCLHVVCGVATVARANHRLQNNMSNCSAWLCHLKTSTDCKSNMSHLCGWLCECNKNHAQTANTTRPTCERVALRVL